MQKSAARRIPAAWDAEALQLHTFKAELWSCGPRQRQLKIVVDQSFDIKISSNGLELKVSGIKLTGGKLPLGPSAHDSEPYNRERAAGRPLFAQLRLTILDTSSGEDVAYSEMPINVAPGPLHSLVAADAGWSSGLKAGRHELRAHLLDASGNLTSAPAGPVLLLAKAGLKAAAQPAIAAGVVTIKFDITAAEDQPYEAELQVGASVLKLAGTVPLRRVMLRRLGGGPLLSSLDISERCTSAGRLTELSEYEALVVLAGDADAEFCGTLSFREPELDGVAAAFGGGGKSAAKRRKLAAKAPVSEWTRLLDESVEDVDVNAGSAPQLPQLPLPTKAGAYVLELCVSDGDNAEPLRVHLTVLAGPAVSLHARMDSEITATPGGPPVALLLGAADEFENEADVGDAFASLQLEPADGQELVGEDADAAAVHVRFTGRAGLRLVKASARLDGAAHELCWPVSLLPGPPHGPSCRVRVEGCEAETRGGGRCFPVHQEHPFTICLLLLDADGNEALPLAPPVRLAIDGDAACFASAGVAAAAGAAPLLSAVRVSRETAVGSLLSFSVTYGEFRLPLRLLVLQGTHLERCVWADGRPNGVLLSVEACGVIALPAVSALAHDGSAARPLPASLSVWCTRLGAAAAQPLILGTMTADADGRYTVRASLSSLTDAGDYNIEVGPPLRAAAAAAISLRVSACFGNETKTGAGMLRLQQGEAAGLVKDIRIAAAGDLLKLADHLDYVLVDRYGNPVPVALTSQRPILSLRRVLDDQREEAPLKLEFNVSADEGGQQEEEERRRNGIFRYYHVALPASLTTPGLYALDALPPSVVPEGAFWQGRQLGHMPPVTFRLRPSEASELDDALDARDAALDARNALHAEVAGAEKEVRELTAALSSNEQLIQNIPACYEPSRPPSGVREHDDARSVWAAMDQPAHVRSLHASKLRNDSGCIGVVGELVRAEGWDVARVLHLALGAEHLSTIGAQSRQFYWKCSLTLATRSLPLSRPARCV